MEITEQNLIERQRINQLNRNRLKNRDFSVISSNCNGAFILHDLGQRFNSPTVNLFLYPKDFIKFIKDLRYYISLELNFIVKEKIEYPVAKLDDIEIYFMHYDSEEQARDKWEERKQRINYDNLFIIMTDRDGCTYNDLKEFDRLEYKNKVVFTHIEYPEIKSSFYIKGYEEENQVGHIYEFVDEKNGMKHYDEFDYVKWFNREYFY